MSASTFGLCQKINEFLSAYPDVEIEVLICDGLDVESYRGDRGDHLANLNKHKVSAELLSPCARACGWAVMSSPSACTTVSSFLRYPVQVARGLSALHLLRSGGRWLQGCRPTAASAAARVRCMHTKPRINIRISFFDHKRPDSHDMLAPILTVCWMWMCRYFVGCWG